MKKICVLIFLASVFTTTVHAQNKPAKKLSWGYTIGLNASDMRIENGANTSWKTGLATGIFLNFKMSDKFSIQPEFLYSSMGASNINGGEGSLRLNYFSIPILAKYEICKNFAAIAGPQIDVLIEAKTKNANSQFTKVTNEFRENSFNLTAGAEYWPMQRFGFSLRYIYGFNDIAASGNAELKNQGIQLMAALKF